MKHRERGFSLVELMVAMVITLIVSGAIYGLLASGQSAFRREPAVVDRQQNIRLALDLIRRDIENGGAGMTAFAQVFTNNLNNPGAQSVPSELLAGERADFLEVQTNDGSCPGLSVCLSPGTALFTNESLPECMFGNPPGPVLGFVSGSGGPAQSNYGPGILWLEPPGPGGGGSCGAGNLVVPAGQATWANPPGGGCPGAKAQAPSDRCESISRIALARWELAPENPAAALDAQRITNPPALWRSEFGRRSLDGSANNGPFVGANSPWQLVARGIDDMQVEYQTGAQWPGAPGRWSVTPGDVTSPNYPTIVRRVRITLSARAIGMNLGGETAGAVTTGRRGQLTTIVVPRSALQGLAQVSPSPNPNPWR